MKPFIYSKETLSEPSYKRYIQRVLLEVYEGVGTVGREGSPRPGEIVSTPRQLVIKKWGM